MGVFSEDLWRGWCLAVLVAATVGSLTVSRAAVAQAKAPGLSPLQSATQDAIFVACPPLAQQGLFNQNGTLLGRFAASCTQMVLNSTAVQSGGGNRTALGIQYETISPTQANAQKPGQIEAISARLLDLRAGARGFLLSQNGVPVGDPRGVAVAGPTSPEGTGGAAGADSDFGGRWGGFMNISYNGGTVDETGNQTGYNFNNWGILAGADYRITDAFVLGGALGYSYTKSNYDFGLGSVKASTISGTLYGTYYVDRWYLDGSLSYGSVGYDTVRNFTLPASPAVGGIPAFVQRSATATASPDGNQWSASISAGYNYAMDSYLITPFVRLGYIEVRNDSFQEDEPINGMGLAIDARTVRSLQSGLGARLSRAFSTAKGVVTPYFTAQWMHEFENSNSSITAKFVNDPANNFFFVPTDQPTRDYAIFAVGVQGQFQNGASAFLQLSTTAWLDNINVYSAIAGVRISF